MSTPFIEIPQRAEALPLITSSPPRPEAPADWLASPLDDHRPGHDVLGHAGASSCPRPDRGELVHPGAVVAHVARRSRPRARRRGRPRPRGRRSGWRPANARGRRGRHRGAAGSAPDRGRREVDRREGGLRRGSADLRPLPRVDAAGLRLPQLCLARRRAALRSRDTPRPSRPSRRSRPSPRACRRSGRAAPRSRRQCRPRTCRSHRGRRGSRRAPSPGRRPRDSRQVR